MSTTTPNMGLVESTIGVDSGLNWETNLNASLTILDGHNHSPGSGVQINPSGILINSDLPFNSYNATLLRSVRFTSQISPLSGASDIGCIYVSGPDLYYNDTAGNQVRMTASGAVNATSSGISSGTATASFSAGVLVVDAASNTPANIQAASILLGNNSAGSKYLTLSPPNSMAASYGVVLPSIPAATSFLQCDTSGNITGSVPVSGGLTGTNLASNLALTGSPTIGGNKIPITAQLVPTIVYDIISAAGNPTYASWSSCYLAGPGSYSLSFPTAYNNPPIVIVTTADGTDVFWSVGNITTTGCAITAINYVTHAYQDTSFSILVIGN